MSTGINRTRQRQLILHEALGLNNRSVSGNYETEQATQRQTEIKGEIENNTHLKIKQARSIHSPVPVLPVQRPQRMLCYITQKSIFKMEAQGITPYVLRVFATVKSQLIYLQRVSSGVASPCCTPKAVYMQYWPIRLHKDYPQHSCIGSSAE